MRSSRSIRTYEVTYRVLPPGFAWDRLGARLQPHRTLVEEFPSIREAARFRALVEEAGHKAEKVLPRVRRAGQHAWVRREDDSGATCRRCGADSEEVGGDFGCLGVPS